MAGHVSTSRSYPDDEEDLRPKVRQVQGMVFGACQRPGLTTRNMATTAPAIFVMDSLPCFPKAFCVGGSSNTSTRVARAMKRHENACFAPSQHSRTDTDVHGRTRRQTRTAFGLWGSHRDVFVHSSNVNVKCGSPPPSSPSSPSRDYPSPPSRPASAPTPYSARAPPH